MGARHVNTLIPAALLYVQLALYTQLLPVLNLQSILEALQLACDGNEKTEYLVCSSLTEHTLTIAGKHGREKLPQFCLRLGIGLHQNSQVLGRHPVPQHTLCEQADGADVYPGAECLHEAHRHQRCCKHARRYQADIEVVFGPLKSLTQSSQCGKPIDKAAPATGAGTKHLEKQSQV